MKSFIRILTAVLLVSATVLSLAGCKQNAKPDTGSETKAIEIASSAEQETSEAAESKVYVIDSKQDELKLRKNPSADADTLQEIPKGAEVTVEEESDGWAKIKYEDKTGWIKSDNVIEVTMSEKAEQKTQSTGKETAKQSGEKSTEGTTKAQTATTKATTSKETTTKSNTTKATSTKATPSDTTTAKATTKSTTKATTSKTTAKETTKASTSAYTGTQKPATVHIRIHGKGNNTKEITAKVNPGENYTNSMAYKAVSNKYPGESFRLKGDNIVNYDPSTGVKDFYMDAYFNDTIEITTVDED